MKKQTTTDKRIKALAREAKRFDRYEDAYRIVRDCAKLLPSMEAGGDKAAAKALRAIGLEVLQRLADDIKGEFDAARAFGEIVDAVGDVVPLFSKRLFTKPPRVKAERPLIDRPVPRAKVDASLDNKALKRIAQRVKADEIEDPEALRLYQRFVKGAAERVVRRDAWRRGKALLTDCQREANNNNFLRAYYAKHMAKYEVVFLAAQPS